METVSKRGRGRPPSFSSDAEFHRFAWESANQNGHPGTRILQPRDMLQVSYSTLTRYAARLEEAGLASRTSLGWLIRNPADLAPSEGFEEMLSFYRKQWPLQGLNSLVGVSDCATALRKAITLVATARISTINLVPVLITGETGTGKELVAKLIHQSSARRALPFVPINTSGIPEELLEAELFGHERGAFTGAVSIRQGWFEVAKEGTVFLDEIGDSNPAFQRKVLRVLESGEYTRLGGVKLFHTFARIIAATNTNLSEAIKAGSFRSDLFYRLNVFPIHISPLRERPEDIDHLLALFVVEREGLDIRQAFTKAALDRLVAHDWPGNVRELRNVAQRAFILAGPGLVKEEHIVF